MVELEIKINQNRKETPIAREQKIKLIRALGEKNGEGCLQTLLRLLKHDPGVERGNSYFEELLLALKNRALRNPDDNRTVNVLVEHLRVRDGCWQTAARVAETLGEIGDWRSVEPLSKHAGSEYYILANSAIRALGKIAEKAHALGDWSAKQAWSKKQTFSELRKHAVPALSAELLGGSRHENQDAAAVSLVEIGPPALDGFAEATHAAVKKWLDEKSKNEKLLPPHEFSLALWVFEKIAELHPKYISGYFWQDIPGSIGDNCVELPIYKETATNSAYRDSVKLLKLILKENKPALLNPASWTNLKRPLPRLG
ncbi:MAG: HEAT repeat domain-containing protein [Candidatus Micrarchaeota archaeon]